MQQTYSLRIMIYIAYARFECFSPQMIYSYIFSSKAQFLEFLKLLQLSHFQIIH